VNENIKVAASENTHETITNLMSSEPRGLSLDVGAGSGALSFKLTELGFNVISTDINPKFKVRELNENINFVLCDLDESVPFKSQTFDYAVAVEIIEHVENPWYFLRELSRILKDGGKLYLTTPNLHAIYQRIYFLFSKPLYSFRYYDFEGNKHITPLFFWNLERMLKTAGFKLEKITFNRGFIPKIRVRKNNLKAPKNFLFGETLIVVAEKVREARKP